MTRFAGVGTLGLVVTITIVGLLAGFARPGSAGGSGWGLAAPIGMNATGSPGDVKAAFDPYGNAIAAWVQSYGNRSDIWASRFVPGSGWSPATAIETGDAAVDTQPLVAMDSQGNGLVVWEHCPPPPPGNYVCTAIYAARFDPDTGWGLPTPIVTGYQGQGSLFVRDLGEDRNGTAIVVWDDAIGGIWATQSTPDNGWQAPTRLGSGQFPRLTVIPNGSAIAVWYGSNGAYSAVWTSHFVPGKGWGLAVVVDPSDQTNATWPGPGIAANADGVAFVVWNQENGTGFDVWAARFAPGAGWSKATRVGPSRWGGPHVEVDAYGNAVAVWMWWAEGNPLSEFLIASRYVRDVGWGPGTRIANLGDEEAGPTFSAAGAPSGDVVVVSSDVWGRINASQFVPGLGWSTRFQLGTGNEPVVAINAQGDGAAVWDSFDASVGVWRIWASLYSAPDFVPNPLYLVVSAPSTLLTNSSTVTVSGMTQPGAMVTVDRAAVPVDRAGAFNYTTVLPDGSHTFVVSAYDASGSMNTKTLTVVVDTRAPMLVLASPSNNMTTSEASIVVSGTAEPDSRLVVNGLSVAVAPDGAFSLRIGLVEGTNTIVATAMDAAGNVATTSVSVTYNNPIVQDLALLRWVAIASFVGVLVVASLLLVLFRTQWRREPETAGKPRNGSRSEPPNGMPDTASDGQAQSNGGLLLRGFAAERRWPAKVASGLIRLTAKERILLHLLHFARYADASEVPPELTQGRIVEATGIGRQHFAQYVHPLVRDGLVQERTAHVRGAVQRRRVYVLTEEGRGRVVGIRDRVRSAMVRVRDASGVREVTVAEALLEARGAMSVLDILRESIETGVVDLTR